MGLILFFQANRLVTENYLVVKIPFSQQGNWNKYTSRPGDAYIRQWTGQARRIQEMSGDKIFFQTDAFKSLLVC